MKPGMITSERAKSIYKWILVIAIAWLVHQMNIFPQDITGSGTSGDPYILYDAYDVDSIRYLGSTTSYFKLNNDIDMSAVSPFAPIERNSATFTGQLDLNHKTISNLTITHTFVSSGIDSVGLFTKIVPPSGNSIPRIKNGTFLNCTLNFSGTMRSAASGLGLICGFIDGAGGSPTAPTIDSIVISYLDMNINFTGGSASISGYAFGAVAGNCISSFEALIDRVAVTDLNVTAVMKNHTHGTPGFDRDGIGGILGYGWVEMNQCFVTGSISATGATVAGTSTRIGGLVGRTRRSAGGNAVLVNDCYVFMSKMENVNGGIGGMMGDNDSSPHPFTDCYVKIDTLISPATSNTNDWDGLFLGVINESTTTFTTCYVDTQVVIDTTELGASDKSIAGYTDGHAGTGITLLTTAQATDSANYTGFNWTTWDWSASMNDSYPFLSWYSYVSYTNPDIKHPDTTNLFFYYDSLETITWSPPAQTAGGLLTSQYLWYSVDAGLNWTFIDSISNIIDSSYIWTVPQVTTTHGRIRVSTNVGGVQDSSRYDFVIAPNEATITILSPTESSYEYSGNNLIIRFESFNVGWSKVWYSKDSSNWVLIQDSLDIDNGNGIPPDTTQTSWFVGDKDLISTTWIKVTAISDTLFTGSTFQVEPYHYTGDLTNRGLRAHIGQAQAKINWSNFFELNGNLYTLSSFLFVWTWFDLQDRYYIYYWNTLTNAWVIVDDYQPATGMDGKLYHKNTSVPFMVYGNADGTDYKWMTWTSSIPPTVSSSISARTGDPISTEGIYPLIYKDQNNSVDYAGWRYYFDGDTIRAYDIFNTETFIDFKFFVLHEDSLSILRPGKVEIFGYDSLLFISNSDHKGNVWGNTVYPMTTYTLPALQQQYGDYAEDIVRISGVAFQERTYFRGIYPEAILQMRSRK